MNGIQPPTGSTDEAHVAFIGATGRSGSTLLSRLMGSMPGVCSVGELCWLWAYGVLGNRNCGCGQAFSDCPFWTSVGSRAFGGFDHVDARRMNDLRRSLTKNRTVPELLVHARQETRSDVAEYASVMGPLYRAILAESGATVVVDNSKQAAVAMLARDTPGVRLSLVHLVRRSHGVAYSWTKHVERSDKTGAEMRRRGPARTAVRWTVDNALYELLGSTGSPRLLVRYEDLMTDAEAQIAGIIDFLGLPDDAAAALFTDDGRVNISMDHSVWGNPMRLRQGPETLRPDTAWRDELDVRSRRLVTTLSAAGLARYGYPLR